MAIPAAYTSHRNLANSYTRGFRAGQLADLGGVPLAPYTRARMRGAFKAGFKDGQRTKVGGFQLDPVEATPFEVTTRERALLALLEQIYRDIAAMLHGGC